MRPAIARRLRPPLVVVDGPTLSLEDTLVNTPPVTVTITDPMPGKRPTFRAQITFRLDDRNVLIIDRAVVRFDPQGSVRLVMPAVRRGEGWASTVRLPQSWYNAAFEAAADAMAEVEATA